jgi:hypothetical protein
MCKFGSQFAIAFLVTAANLRASTANAMASYIDKIPLGQGIVKQKLKEFPASGVMFDVPNPESDIDPDSTVEDGRRAFEQFRSLRDKRARLR